MTDFDGVVAAWQNAEVTAIHPLRGPDEAAYWESGVFQAAHAAQYIPEGGSVMDFGCGDGRIAIPLAKRGFHVLAVDSSETMLLRLAQKADGRITRYLSNGTDLAVTFSESFDTIVCRAVLIHHSHIDGAHLVAQLADCLKSGGHLIADWPVGRRHERTDWIDVTVWAKSERHRVATDCGLILVDDGEPSVWVKD